MRIAEIGMRAWKPIYDGYRKQLGAELFEAFYPDADYRKQRELMREMNTLPTFVGELDGAVVAFAMCRMDAGTGEIMNNAVDPEYAGRGIGSAMQRFLLVYMRRQGCTHAIVQTGLDDAHAPARRSYEKNGFERALQSVKYFRKL